MTPFVGETKTPDGPPSEKPGLAHGVVFPPEHPGSVKTKPRKTKINPRLMGALICMAEASLLATRLLVARKLRLVAEGDCTGVESAQIFEECGDSIGRGSAGTRIREPTLSRTSERQSHPRVHRKALVARRIEPIEIAICALYPGCRSRQRLEAKANLPGVPADVPSALRNRQSTRNARRRGTQTARTRRPTAHVVFRHCAMPCPWERKGEVMRTIGGG